MQISEKRVIEDGVIHSITKEDVASIEVMKEKLLSLGRATYKADREKANRLVDQVYKERGLEPPEHKIWLESPKAALEYINKAMGTKSRWYPACYGAHDLYWIGHWKFIRDQFNLKTNANPDPQFELVEAAGGWWWPFKTAVIFSERPSTLKLDNEGRLHCESGPAMAWDDGFALYSWHGTLVPKEWILNPEKQNPKDALTWENIEQRRCLAEILGWEKVLNQLECDVIDEDDPEIGTLLQVDLPDSPRERFLKVRCGTGRTFVLPVPPNMKTAQEANAWTYGITTEDLMNLEVRT